MVSPTDTANRHLRISASARELMDAYTLGLFEPMSRGTQIGSSVLSVQVEAG